MNNSHVLAVLYTPSLAIQHDFGVIDVDLDISFVKLHKLPDKRFVNRLLARMINRVIPRYYSHVKTLIKMFGFTDINGMLIVKNRTEEVKSS